MPRRDVSIIIPCFNKVDYTIRCLESLAANTPADRYEVVIVDNASADDTPALCEQLEGDVVVIRNEENLGFSKACNQGAEAASGRHLLFLNNDTEALRGWLEPLLRILDDEPDVGAVGSKLLFPDGTLQHAGVVTFEVERGPAVGASHIHYRLPPQTPAANIRRDLEVVTGACAAFRRDAFEPAGGFDEGYWNGNEDVDLCLALRQAGWRVVYEPASVLYHHESVSGPERWRRVDDNVRRLGDKWADVYVPEYLIAEGGMQRPHPRRARIEVVVSGAGAGPLDLERTVRAAQRALRPTDSIAIVPDVGAPPALAGGRTRIGLPDPSADYHLDVSVGVLLDRQGLDALVAVMGDHGVATAGPVLSDGWGQQSFSHWHTEHVSKTALRRRILLSGAPHGVLAVGSLDRRCILRRVGASGGKTVVAAKSYVETTALPSATRNAHVGRATA